VSARYDTDPPDDLRDRYRRALTEAVDGATDALDGAGERNAFRMHYTLGQIEDALDSADYTIDRRSARLLARIRARIDAYNHAQEGGSYR
jgi:hypothetical protein